MRNVVRNLVRMAAGPIRERGWKETFRSMRGCFAARQRERIDPFDERWRTDTTRTVTLEALSSEGDDVPGLWRYWPTLPETFVRVLGDVDVHHEHYTFVDLGSGKGRVVLMASEWPFHSIVGVELCPSLHRAAERNLASCRTDLQRCRAVQLICCDAAAYRWPAEPVVAYMFQPFPAETMRATLQNLRVSAATHGTDAVVVYLNPIFHQLICESGFAPERTGRDEQIGF